MKRNVSRFAAGLENIDLENIIKKSKQITLDYQWYFKGGNRYRTYIAVYADSKEVARVYLDKGPVDNEKQAEEIILDAYAAMEMLWSIPKRVKVRGVYLKGHPGKEKNFSYLR